MFKIFSMAGNSSDFNSLGEKDFLISYAKWEISIKKPK